MVAHAQPDAVGATKVDEVPYDFVRKRLSVVVQEGEHLLLITKGALDNVLAVCTRVQDGDIVVPLDDGRRTDIQRRFEAWSDRGLVG